MSKARDTWTISVPKGGTKYHNNETRRQELHDDLLRIAFTKLKSSSSLGLTVTECNYALRDVKTFVNVAIPRIEPEDK